MTLTIVDDEVQLQSKQAIVGSLPALEALIREYVDHLAPRDRLQVQLTFSAFLIWARKRQEAVDVNTADRS